MVRGAQEKSHARFAVAVSGVAGPDGGSPSKPVGTVWLAWASASRCSVSYSTSRVIATKFADKR